MEIYLRETLEKLNSDHYGDLTLVLGNESCDLDSAVSSIVYAAFLYWQHSQIKCKVCTRTSRDESTYQDDIFVPVLNAERKDFPLKTEVLQCLRDHGINDSILVFRDDFDLQRITSFNNKTTVVLVDHHVLAKKDRFLAAMVTEIIDHRQVDRSTWQYKEDTRSCIEQVGSCCSLITQRIRNLSVLMAREADFFEAYPTATDMLLCGVILDTVNFSKEVKKATQVDEDMVRFLESVLKPEYKNERKDKLDRLLAARKDVSGLSTKQILRKDAKIAGDVLVPSFPILVQDFLRKPDALKSVFESLEQNHCSLALLLGMSLVNGLERDGALVPAQGNEAKQSQLINFLQQWKMPHLQIQIEEDPNLSSDRCIYFKQNNISASRKQYMPVITEFLNMNVKFV